MNRPYKRKRLQKRRGKLRDTGEEQHLPIRTLHDFLVEINDEWSGFRMTNLLNILIILVLFIMFIPRYFLITLRTPGPVDTLIAFGIIVALICCIYLTFRQYRFYQKWERRMGLLLHIEEKLLSQ